MDEAYLLACVRYVELNPVRAGLVGRAEQWPWSSAQAHLGLGGDRLTELAPMLERVADWRAMLDSGLGDEEREAIRAASGADRRLRRRLPARLAAAAGRPSLPTARPSRKQGHLTFSDPSRR